MKTFFVLLMGLLISAFVFIAECAHAQPNKPNI
ncbi:MAG: hypothetical protein H6Q04_2941 [Acidobacteria bacterium]|nr:hypothetical protein [Acidobacteriota bacterium]